MAGGKNFVDMVESIEHYKQVSKPTEDSLFEFMAQRMFRDAGHEEMPTSPQEMSDLWEDLFRSKLWRVKGPRVAMSRWMGWLDCAEFFDTDWWKRVMSLAVVGLMQGWLTKGPAQDSLLGLVPKTVEAKSTKESKERTQNLRDKCKNSMHVSFVLMSDLRILARVRMILYSCKSSRALFGQCVAACRTPGAGLAFFQDMAQGQGHLEAVRDFAAPWRDIRVLSKIGFQTEFAEFSKDRTFDADHPLVRQGADLAAELGAVTFAMMRARLRSLATWMWGYPGRFVLLVHPNESVVQDTLLDMKVVWKYWREVQALNSGAWKRFVEACAFSWEYVSLVFNELAKNGFERVTPMVEELVRCSYEGFSNTKTCEDAIKVCRDMGRNNPDMRPSGIAIFRQPYIEHVLSENHKYNEIEAEEVPAPDRPTDCASAASMLHPKYRRSSMDFKEITGRSAKTEWTSFNATSERALAEHAPVLVQLGASGDLGRIGDAWRAHFFQPGLVVRRKGMPWQVCLGPMVTGVLCWRAEKVASLGMGEAFDFGPATKDNVSIVAVASFEGWEARATEWCSPAQVFVQNKRRQPDSWPRAYLRPKGPPKPILRIAAECCYWNLGAGILKRLISHHYPDLRHLQQEPLPEILAGLVEAQLGCEGEETARVLEKRAFGAECQEELAVLSSVEVGDMLDKRDGDIVGKFVADKEEDAQARVPMAQKVQALRQGGTRRKGKRTAVQTVPHGLRWSNDEANLLMPPRGRIVRDEFNGRWLCSYAGLTSKSRSWGSGSDEACVLWLARWAWMQHQEVTGEECPWADLPEIQLGGR